MAVLLCLTLSGAIVSQEEEAQRDSTLDVPAVLFEHHVFPILKRYCLPCHAEENFNPSELFLDSYDGLMAGGKHGPAVVAKRSKESLIMAKVGLKPPFGDRMPLPPRKKGGESAAKKLTEEELKTIADWIDQGAKRN